MTDFLLALLVLNVAMWLLLRSLGDVIDSLPEPKWLRHRTERRTQRVMQEISEAIKAGLIQGLQNTHLEWPPKQEAKSDGETGI